MADLSSLNLKRGKNTRLTDRKHGTAANIYFACDAFVKAGHHAGAVQAFGPSPRLGTSCRPLGNPIISRGPSPATHKQQAVDLHCSVEKPHSIHVYGMCAAYRVIPHAHACRHTCILCHAGAHASVPAGFPAGPIGPPVDEISKFAQNAINRLLCAILLNRSHVLKTNQSGPEHPFRSFG